MTVITDKKLRDEIMKEKTLELKKVIELIIQNTYENKNYEKKLKKEHNPGSFDINKKN